MWIKICGNTRLEDCLVAADAGADAVGFVFAEGKRTVSAAEAAAITKQLPPGLETIGVFDTGSPAAIAYAVQKTHISGVQLHRSYDPYIIRRVGEYLDAGEYLTAHPQPRFVQVVSWYVDQPAKDQAHAVASLLRTIEADGLVDAVLLDSRTAQANGGTGEVFDWAAAAGLLRSLRLPFIVAGGLTPFNVKDATRTLTPAGVDVSGGVEQAPGVKDAGKIRSFIENARTTDMR